MIGADAIMNFLVMPLFWRCTDFFIDLSGAIHRGLTTSGIRVFNLTTIP
jgi:hypothetical protein